MQKHSLGHHSLAALQAKKRSEARARKIRVALWVSVFASFFIAVTQLEQSTPHTQERTEEAPIISRIIQDKNPEAADIKKAHIVPLPRPDRTQKFYQTKQINIEEQNNLYVFLQEQGSSEEEAYGWVTALRRYFNPMHLHKMQSVTFYERDSKLRKMIFKSHKDDMVIALRDGEQYHAAQRALHKDFVLTFKTEAIIRGNFARALAFQGVPAQVVRQTLKILSFDLDLQRDINNGDEIKLMYEITRNRHDYTITDEKLLMIRMTFGKGKRNFIAYRFDGDDSNTPFYHATGMSVAKSLLKTPVDGAYLTSGFGERVDPFLGYTRMHRGTDFGAKTGTPIYAAGDGIIQKREVRGGYGNYISMRHDTRFRTAYAHMDGYKEGLKVGDKVMQGDVIGYVGSTGRSTGPHLHYEVMVHGEQINSQELDLPSARRLTGNDLREFKIQLRHYEQIYAALPTFHLASRNP